MPQGRLLGRFRQRGPVPRGRLRMPALPVAQMPGASQADMARMALLAVELAAKADARLVLKRRDARIRAETRRAAQGTQSPSGCPYEAKSRENAAFSGLLGRFSGVWRDRKRPPGVGSPWG